MPDPISSTIQTLTGLGQLLFSGKGKAEKALEAQANSYQTPSSILDYYNKALNRYTPNAYQSAGYQQQNNQKAYYPQ